MSKDRNRPMRLAFATIVAAVLALSATAPAGAARKAPTDDYLAKLPPLIERDLFFGDPQLSGAQISPDGRWISFRKQYRDVMNIWVKGVDEPFDAARPMTADTERPVRGYFWTEDSRYILYVQDKGGDENYHVYAVDPEGSPQADTGVPAARDLTPIDGIRAAIYAVPEATPTRIIIGLNDRDAAMHDVYRLDLATGERELLIENDKNVAAWITDLGGTVRLAWRQTEDGGSEMLTVKDGKLGPAIYTCNFEESCNPVRFHKDGKRVYISSDRGDDVDLARLLLLDVATRETELVESDPEGEVDFGGPIFSDATEELVGTVYVGDRVRIYPRTKQLKRDLKILRKKLPDGELGISASTEDERYAVVSVSRDVNPGSVYLYDQEKGSVEKLYDSRPDLPSEHLATMSPVRYPTRDGVEIPGYLTVPKGVRPDKLPTVLLPHGGPWGRDRWGYDSFAQFLANRGYAVFQPNFRGSTGYGKAFLNAGNGEWGTGLMQHDLTDAVKYLVDEGISDPERVAIMGGSYGGYATLAGVTFTPDLYAAGVSIVGPSNIITLLESIPPYWGPIRKIFEKRVGDLDDPADRERLEAQSPFFHATRIKAPLLVIQGANDPRVKQAESDQIVVALRELERPVEYLVAPDEGHGFAGEENRLAMFAVIEKFLAGKLAGRYQEGAAPEVEARIASLQVDVDTVEMPKAHGGAELAKTAPLPRPDSSLMRAATLSYSSDLSMGGQQMKLESTREIKRDTVDNRDVWRIETRTTMPMGEISEVFLLDAADLSPVHRAVKQGPVDVALDFADDAITGNMKLPGREMPVNVQLEAPVFGNDAALYLELGALPLKPGYKATYRTFDVQTQKVRLWSADVAGTESVEVPAGRFDAYKVVIAAIDGEGGGGTLWISNDRSRTIVRSELDLPPQAGGGKLVTQLTGQ